MREDEPYGKHNSADDGPGYEDNISGKLTDERFSKMMATYEQEQKELETSTTELERAIKACEQQKINVDSFLKLLRSYIEPKQLTPEVLRMFIEKIVVCTPEKSNGSRTQQIDIHYNFVGQFNLSVEIAKDQRKSKADIDTQLFQTSKTVWFLMNTNHLAASTISK